MRIFLTGASGHVGAPLLQELMRQGHQVTILMRPAVLGSPLRLPPAGCKVIYASLADLTPALPVVAEADAVIHLASPRSQVRKVVLEEDIAATGRLLDAWQRGPFLYASSQTVYGIPGADLTEDSGLFPGCWYDVAKVANEMQLLEAADSANRKGIALRLAILYSSRAADPMPQYLPALVAAVARRRTFIFRDEQTLAQAGTSYIGDRDLARAIIAAIGLDASGPYNVAGGFATWRQLLEGIGARLGLPVAYRVGSDQPADESELRLPQSRSYLVTERFNRATGFTPVQRLDDIILEAVRDADLSRAAGR